MKIYEAPEMNILTFVSEAITDDNDTERLSQNQGWDD